MRIAGIIAEYNPFHNGHYYHIERTREKTEADGIVCVISGHFTQRGEPTVVDKWARTEMALQSGADVILEMPTVFATGSAQYFARGGVATLQATGVIDHLSFGSEIPQLELLQKIANIFLHEPSLYKTYLITHLKNGLSYPHARMQSLLNYLKAIDASSIEKIESILKQPNNILAIEYLQALQYLQSSISPVASERLGSSYHEEQLDNHSRLSSATAIRKKILSENTLSRINSYIPEHTLNILNREIKAGKGPVMWENLSQSLLVLLRQAAPQTLAQFPEMEIGLENRFYRAASQATTLTHLLEHVKTKRYTYTRLQRILCYILLGLTKEKQTRLINGGPQYLRVLGFSQTGRQILQEMKHHAALPLLTTIGKHTFSKQSQSFIDMLQLDLLASDVYTLAFPDITKRTGNRDYYEQVIRI